MRLAAAAFGIVLAVASAAAADLPKLSIETTCIDKSIDAIGDEVKARVARCIERQQQSYRYLSVEWPRLSPKNQSACLSRSDDYERLEYCVERSLYWEQEASQSRNVVATVRP